MVLRLAVILGDNLFGRHGHQMGGAIAEILDRVRMTVQPGGRAAKTGSAAAVKRIALIQHTRAHVGVRDGVALQQAAGQRGGADGAGEAAVAGAKVAAIPAGGWQPDLNQDL